MLMERMLARVGQERPIETIEMGTNETIKQSVMAGLGIAFISAHTCLSELADGKLVALKIKGLPLVCQWYVLHRADRDLSKAAQLLESFVVDNWSGLVPGISALKV